ncbi:MAG: hypothetical protein LW707_00490 [Sphingobacteriales bacterium]|nr:hypothetical protein [Sphingobacteriales bacterium]
MNSPDKIAIVDCGTNTFNLLIASQKANDGIRFHCRERRSVKIGTRKNLKSEIPQDGLNRAYNALTSYKSIIEEAGCSTVIAVGTAALRESANGQSFIQTVRTTLGIDIKTISGNREATLITKGVLGAFSPEKGCSLIVDIGGGSTEFILIDRGKIHWKKSFKLGAARLLALHPLSDLPKRKEIRDLESYLDASLTALAKACDLFRPVRLIGSSGSFDTLAEIILRQQDDSLGKSVHYRFKKGEYQKMHQSLISSTKKQRIGMPGMLRMRADMIVPASILINFVLKRFSIRSMHLSTFALKEGLLFEFLEKRKNNL